MIWYLLYPFRGTTEPPVLDTKHPLRIAFTRYGNHAARHPVITLLISVATATILIYPFPFLYTNNFTNGASNLPHHVWTSAQPVVGDIQTTPDVVMRSIWVHGSYMKALLPNVLHSALQIQDELLGPTINFDPRRPQNTIYPDDFSGDLTPDMRDRLHAINGLSNSSWFFHSPLQYWMCSSEGIAEDKDIIATVNEGSRRSTSVNVTLRHSIVFSGKRFEDHRLVAADALVVTLVHMLDSPVGRHWEKKAREIARSKSGKWRLYPPDGRSLTSTLYEFRFQPLSFQDDMFLGIAYALTAAYFCLSLSRLRALKSRLGLLVAVVSQIAVSIMSSFTICAILKIDLSKIPREAYPLVILTVGMENIFRLINAVIMTPPEASTTSRMATALGQTGHMALAGAAQNLAILWMLNKVVSPGVAAFCTFAALALMFDFFYLLTFFLAVLSIDVQRTELNDYLSRASMRSQRPVSPDIQQRQTWSDALLRGEAPISTRVAGTVMMISFIIAAQWHFFENESFCQTVSRFIRLMKEEPQNHPQSSVSMLSVDINQARTPTAWLQMQDHETAHEFIQVIKPNSHSYIARVYDPLVFVLNGSDRTPNRLGVRRFLPAFYDFTRNQMTRFMVTVVLVVAAVSLFMNYLLWDELVDDDVEKRPEDDPLLSVKTLNKGHALDVVLLTASNNGIVATVGLDRWIRTWDLRSGGNSYLVQDPESDFDPFPVLAMAIDNGSNWLAILSSKNLVALWNIPKRRWGPTMKVRGKIRTPAAFFFVESRAKLVDPVIIVWQNGLMLELHVDSNESNELQISRTPLVSARLHVDKSTLSDMSLPHIRIIAASKRGCVCIASKTGSGWISKEIPCKSERDTDVISILPLSLLSSFLVIRSETVELIDISTHRVIYTFKTKPMKQDTLRCLYSIRQRPQCGWVSLASLALAYTSADTGNCIMQLYLPQHESNTICFRDPSSPCSSTCSPWEETVEHFYFVENPGDWEALQVGYVVGVRKCEHRLQSRALAAHHEILGSGIRRRGSFKPRQSNAMQKEGNEDKWEAWSISTRGEMATIPLSDYSGKSSGLDHLLVGSVGPLKKLGKRSLAVGLGNVVKIITVGNERFENLDSGSDDGTFVGAATSRKRKIFGVRKRSSSLELSSETRAASEGGDIC